MTHLPPPTTQTFQPLNEEPPSSKLISHHLTPVQDSYARNHGPIPHLSASSHRITISDSRTSNHNAPSLLAQELTLSLNDLAKLPQTTLICALQCAGNRRHEMRTRIKEVEGIDWGVGAVMNASWTGVLLVDVFSHLLSKSISDLIPLDQRERHIAFSCSSVSTASSPNFASSLPLSLALSPSRQILLATAQNGQPLTAEHGFPVRVIAPGIAGARSVKWLDRITIQDEESDCFYMQRDYKILPPHVNSAEQAEEWWDRVDALLEMGVNSVVVSVSDMVPNGDEGSVKVDRGKDGRVVVKGYALPGGDGGPVTEVEVRVDHGDWVAAELLKDEEDENDVSGGKWSWMLWRASIEIEKGRHVIWSRASDAAGHRQEEERSEWNLRGMAYNGFGELDVDVS